MDEYARKILFGIKEGCFEHLCSSGRTFTEELDHLVEKGVLERHEANFACIEGLVACGNAHVKIESSECGDTYGKLLLKLAKAGHVEQEDAHIALFKGYMRNKSQQARKEMPTYSDALRNATEDGYGYCWTYFNNFVLNELKEAAYGGKIDQEDAHLAIYRSNKMLLNASVEAVINGFGDVRLHYSDFTYEDLLRYF
ncbi:hypothetical protein KY311_01885, partial [Candidatus Woesearchaeota archaeon]|nr:hypothetical protein [Candidatus Woesearchaeota archaeon]